MHHADALNRRSIHGLPALMSEPRGPDLGGVGIPVMRYAEQGFGEESAQAYLFISFMSQFAINVRGDRGP